MSESLTLRQPVIDRLFQRLNLIYGRAWLDMWKDIDVVEAKGQWAETLGKYSLETIKQALDFCAASVKYPPNLPEFVMICDNYHRPEQPLKLERKFSELEMEINRGRVANMIAGLVDKRDYRGWAKKIMANPKAFPENSVRLAREALAERVYVESFV